MRLVGSILRNGWKVTPRLRDLMLERWPMRIPDRSKGHFGDGRHARLSPQGRPTDLFGDVVINVSRVRAMEDAA
jgi:hypothetical protein